MISIDMYWYKTNVHQNFSLNVVIIQKCNCPSCSYRKQFSKVLTNASRNTLDANHPHNGEDYEIFHSTLYNRPSDWKRKATVDLVRKGSWLSGTLGIFNSLWEQSINENAIF